MNNDPHHTSEPSVPFVYPDDEEEQPPVESNVPAGAETVLRELIDWLFPPKAKPSAVLLRAYALAWYIQPESIKQHTSRSQRALADYLNVSKASLSWQHHSAAQAFRVRGQWCEERGHSGQVRGGGSPECAETDRSEAKKRQSACNGRRTPIRGRPGQEIS